MRTELIAKHLAPTSSLEEELAILSTQSPDKQAEIERRLTAIDQFLSSDGQSVADADSAAGQLGLSRRSFYRLLAKLREHGAVRALAPGYRNVQRQSPTRDGLGEAVEAMLQKCLQTNPDSKLAAISNFVKTACAEHGVAYPGEAAIRRRVQALRSAGSFAGAAGELGDRIAVDQCAISMRLVTGRPAVVTLIIDEQTKLILSASVSEPNDGGEGLATAVRKCRARLSSLSVYKTATGLRSLTWIVPPAAEWLCELERCGLPHLRGTDISVIGNDPKRHGDLIVRLLGDRLGPYEFRRFATAVNMPMNLGGGQTQIDDAERMVDACVDSWNRRVSQAMALAAPDRLSAKSKKLADRIERAFQPVFDAIENRQLAARRQARARGELI